MKAVPESEQIPYLPAGILRPTRWSRVRLAARGGAAGHDALDEILCHYWYPLYAWARRRGLSAADASDGVQSFLEVFCSENHVTRASEEKGRLRSWMLTCFTRHLAGLERRERAQKRGGKHLHVTIDGPGAELIYQSEPALTESPERLYARAWAISLMEEALRGLSRYYEKSGQKALGEALYPALESPLPDLTYADVAAALSMKETAVRGAAVRMRQRYRRILLELAAERLGITSEAALAAEIRALLSGSD